MTQTTSQSHDEWQAPTWDEIVTQHSARVYRLAYRLTGNPHDAEDLTQEVFVRVFRSLSSYTPGTFEGWLHRITTNLFLDQARRKAKIRFDALTDDAETRIPSRMLAPRGVGDLGELPLEPLLVLDKPAAGRADQHVVPGALGALGVQLAVHQRAHRRTQVTAEPPQRRHQVTCGVRRGRRRVSVGPE